MEKRTIRVVKLREAVGKNKNKELDDPDLQMDPEETSNFRQIH